MQAAEYERIARVQAEHWWYDATRALLRDVLLPHFAAAAHAGGGLRTLDTGAGTGATGAWLAEHGRVFALDRSPLALARQPRDATEAICGDASSLPIRSGTIDVVLCVTVLYHQWVDDPAAAVREMARTLRPGGWLCLLEPGIRRLRRSHDRQTFTARRFALADLVRLSQAAGLETVRATGVYAFLAPLAILKAMVERGGRSASDLDAGGGIAGAVLARLAQAERRLLRRRSLPFGLSVLVLARKPLAAGTTDDRCSSVFIRG